MRTILYLTNTGRLDGLIGGLYGVQDRYATVHAALGAGSPVVQWASRDRQLVTAKDTWENSVWLETYLGTLSGSLHVVRHTEPKDNQWAQVVAVLDSMRSKLALSYGNQGRHEADRNIPQSKLYCYLADAVVAKLEPVNAVFTETHFDGLWEELETHFPIEDLLADKLAYLHAAFAGVAPTEGAALKAALDKSGDRERMTEYLSKLGRPYETGLFADFTKLRDLILGLKDTTAQP